MIVGVPSEIKNNPIRVAVIPAGAAPHGAAVFETALTDVTPLP